MQSPIWTSSKAVVINSSKLFQKDVEQLRGGGGDNASLFYSNYCLEPLCELPVYHYFAYRTLGLLISLLGYP